MSNRNVFLRAGIVSFNENGNPFCEGTTSYCQLPPFVFTGFFVLVLAPLYRGMTVYLDPRACYLANFITSSAMRLAESRSARASTCVWSDSSCFLS